MPGDSHAARRLLHLSTWVRGPVAALRSDVPAIAAGLVGKGGFISTMNSGRNLTSANVDPLKTFGSTRMSLSAALENWTVSALEK